jgi:cation diffusion facilitator CzcD-associated flavoprotein CzcO
LKESWKDGAFAYLGVTTHKFPNMFMLYGPNTNTGHTSIIYKLEAQFEHILKLLSITGDGIIEVKGLSRKAV